MKITVLSIDWDYFFPDPAWYDWTHNEESAIFYEMAWSTRAGNRNIRTGQVAHESFVPDRKLLDGFWGRVLDPKSYPLIYVMESHKSLGQILLPSKFQYDIWNFDQHHDLGYDDRKEMDCGNWAAHVLRKHKRSSYHLVYPPWRSGDDGEKPPAFFPDKRASIKTSEPATLRPHVIFICRSSCWTPSWADDDWLNFLEPLKLLSGGRAWENRQTVEFVTRAREPGKSQARLLAAKWDEMLKATMA